MAGLDHFRCSFDRDTVDMSMASDEQKIFPDTKPQTVFAILRKLESCGKVRPQVYAHEISRKDDGYTINQTEDLIYLPKGHKDGQSQSQGLTQMNLFGSALAKPVQASTIVKVVFRFKCASPLPLRAAMLLRHVLTTVAAASHSGAPWSVAVMSLSCLGRGCMD